MNRHRIPATVSASFLRPSSSLPFAVALSICIVFFIASCGVSQDAPEKTSHDDSSLTHQLHELQSKVAKLEAALKQNHQAIGTSGQASMKMSGMQGGSTPSTAAMDSGMASEMSSMQSSQSMGGMGMSGMKNMPMMGGMSRQGMSEMRGMSGMGMMGKGMMMMGQMQGMGQMEMPSAMPGFPGASHIYHIGSTNYYLDHPHHITLSPEQQTKLNQIKQRTMLDSATTDRWIAQAEQELWLLTSADMPDAKEIEEKVWELGKLQGDKRISFIRSVGEAAKVLSEEQRKTLIGTLPPNHAASSGSGRN